MHTGNLCVRRARCDCGQDTRSLCVRTDREQIGPGGLREQARHAQPEFSREAAACESPARECGVERQKRPSPAGTVQVRIFDRTQWTARTGKAWKRFTFAFCESRKT